MKIVLVSKCSLDIKQYVEFKMSVLISPSRASLIRVGSHFFNASYSFHVYLIELKITDRNHKKQS